MLYIPQDPQLCKATDDVSPPAASIIPSDNRKDQSQDWPLQLNFSMSYDLRVWYQTIESGYTFLLGSHEQWQSTVLFFSSFQCRNVHLAQILRISFGEMLDSRWDSYIITSKVRGSSWKRKKEKRKSQKMRNSVAEDVFWTWHSCCMHGLWHLWFPAHG